MQLFNYSKLNRIDYTAPFTLKVDLSRLENYCLLYDLTEIKKMHGVSASIGTVQFF